MLVRLASAEEDERSPLAMQALAALGIGASSVLDELSQFITIIAQNEMSGNRTGMMEGMVAVLKQLGPVANPLLNDLYQALSSPDEDIQWTASRLLNLMGPSVVSSALQSIEQLHHALLVSDYKVYMNIVGVLNHLGEAATPVALKLSQMLLSSDGETSARASLLLREMYPVAIFALHRLILDSDSLTRPLVCRKVASVLYTIEHERLSATSSNIWTRENQLEIENVIVPLIKDLLPGLSDEDKDSRNKISAIIEEVLPYIGDKAKPIVEDLFGLFRTSIQGRTEILEILSNLKTVTLPLDRVQLLLRSPNQEIRKHGLRMVQQLGSTAQPALREIRAMLLDSSKQIREESLRALMSLDLDVSEWHDDLHMLLYDKDVEVRIAATKFLHRLSLTNHLLIEKELHVLLCDSIPDIRISALNVLEKVGAGPISEALLEDLYILLDDSSASVRSSAVIALGKIQPNSNSLLSKIRPLLHDSDQDVRKSVIRVLSELRPVTIVTLIDLCEALRDPHREVRALSFNILQPRSQETSPDIISQVTQPEVFHALCTEGITGIQVVRSLQRALHDADSDVRAKAVIIVGNLQHALHDANSDVLAKAVKAATKPLLRDLRSLIRDPDKDVRRAIVQALGNLGSSVNWSIDKLCSLLPDREFEKGLWFHLFLKMSGTRRGFPNDDVVRALGQAGPLSPSVLRDLSGFLGGSEQAVSIVARELTDIQDAEAKSVASNITNVAP